MHRGVEHAALLIERGGPGVVGEGDVEARRAAQIERVPLHVAGELLTERRSGADYLAETFDGA